MDKRTIEGIESCRPGSVDLQAPEQAEVARQVAADPQVRAHYDRVQQFDAAVRQSLDRVEVPVGLAARIVAALAAAESGGSHLAGVTAALEQPPADEPNAPAVAAASKLPTAWSRRQWLGTLATTAAGLALALVLSRWLGTHELAPIDELAQDWQQLLGERWQDLAKVPRGFAFPPGILGVPGGWQYVADKRLPARGVAYQLHGEHGREALLYVMPLDWPEAPPAPALEPQSTTGGAAIGYWRRGDKLYVLVAPNAASYRQFVSSSPVPVA